MKILHTSDWHVGRAFHGTSTIEPLGTVLDALVQVVKDRKVDVVAVAGDVFDTATPSGDAYSLLSLTLGAIRDAGAVVVMTSGNHDAAERLGFLAAFTARAGLHIATRPEDLHVPIVLEDEHGPVHFYGIPYLEPRLIAHRFPDATLRTQEVAMRFALGRIRDAHPDGVRSVVLAHTFVSAGARSADADAGDAPRDFSQGGVDVVPLDLFDDVTYAALGHLHGRITLAEHVRYSGAPLYYAFGDVGKKCGGWPSNARTPFTQRLDSPRPERTRRARLGRRRDDGRIDARSREWRRGGW
jgi:exonuclease SbcD